jgi:protein-S-isoprenylcysteine O-methyltransferase Ste14
MSEKISYDDAKKRAHQIKSFYSNLISYVVVNIVLFIVNIVTSPDSLWFYWVLIFWGIGLIFHAISTFSIQNKELGKNWEEKKAKEIIEKEEKENK